MLNFFLIFSFDRCVLWQKKKLLVVWVILKVCLVWKKSWMILYMKKECVGWWLGPVHIVSLLNSDYYLVVFLWLIIKSWSQNLKLGHDGGTEGPVFLLDPLKFIHRLLFVFWWNKNLMCMLELIIKEAKQ